MGTEIILRIHGLIHGLNHTVKLNNPLMGTEILSAQLLHTIPSRVYVKLNNPLMGTEIKVLPALSVKTAFLYR